MTSLNNTFHDSTTTYLASSEHLYSEIASEAVILDLKSGVYFGLNDTGNQVWHWLQTPKTSSELLKLLLDEYDVTLEEATADLQNLLLEMVNNGLVKTVNEQVSQVL